MATALCRDQGVEFTLVIPADIPLIESFELQKIVDAAPQKGVVLVPIARDAEPTRHCEPRLICFLCDSAMTASCRIGLPRRQPGCRASYSNWPA